MNPPVEPRIAFRFTAEALAGTIYGFVTAMAVIAALADKAADVFVMSGAAIGASLALALTYVYAHWLAGSYSKQPGHAGSRNAWRFELPTLIGPVLLSVVMIGEHLAGVDVVAAAESTMWIGTAILLVLGYRIAIYGGHSRRAAVGWGLLDASIGASLVLVKVLVH